jgi:hypothetical protein
MEVLSNAEKRRQFDSVDSFYTELEEDVPTVQAFAKRTSEDFFSTFGPVYEREARFSKNPLEEVPMLGSSNDTKASVEAFYDFWYNFDSWRSFEYLDKEVNEGSDRYDYNLIVKLVCPDQDCSAATTKGTLRRKTSQSEPGGKKKITPVCATSSIEPYNLIPASNE